MLVNDLDGVSYNWKIKAGINKNRKRDRSQLHLRARKVLHQKYGTLDVLEEVKFRVATNKFLRFDFFIPLLKTAIEVHGAQHFSFNSFFHKSKLGYIKQQQRDRLKKEWCILNNIILIEFIFNESPQEWKDKL